MKRAIFIQALALFTVQPILLKKAKVIRHGSREALQYFIPATIIFTPLGQITGQKVSTDIIKAGSGVLVTLITVFEIYLNRKRIYGIVKCPCRESNETIPNNNVTIEIQEESQKKNSFSDEKCFIQDESTEKDHDDERKFSACFWTFFAGAASGYLGEIALKSIHIATKHLGIFRRTLWHKGTTFDTLFLASSKLFLL